jgi:hypothetical protein
MNRIVYPPIEILHLTIYFAFETGYHKTSIDPKNLEWELFELELNTKKIITHHSLKLKEKWTLT